MTCKYDSRRVILQQSAEPQRQRSSRGASTRQREMILLVQQPLTSQGKQDWYETPRYKTRFIFRCAIILLHLLKTYLSAQHKHQNTEK